MKKVSKTHKTLLAAWLVILFLSALPVCGEFVFLPEDKLEPNENGALIRSMASEILYTYSFIESKLYLGFNAGIKFPIVAWRNPHGFETEFGTTGGIFTRFELFTPSFNFIHGDFLLSVYADCKIQPFLWGLAFTHISSHLGDDYVRLNSPPIEDTGYESLKIYSRYLGKWIKPNLGLEWKFASRPKDLFKSPISLFTGLHLSLLPMRLPFFFESEAEIFDLAALPNFGLRVGIYLKYLFNQILLKKREVNPAREYHELSCTYYYGLSKLGYFTDKRESLLLIGPSFRF